jgi:hypothetical protein
MIILYKLLNWNYAMFISLNAFEDVVCLKFYKNLYYCLLHPSFCHQLSIVRSCKSFFPNFYSHNGFHSISDLIPLFRHELARSSEGLIKFGASVKNEDITFLFKMNFIQNLNTRKS